MKKKTATTILILAVALTMGLALDAQAYTVVINPASPDPICVGVCTTLTADWTVGRNGQNWYQWFVNGDGVGSPVGFDASPGAGNMFGTVSYVFTGASAGSYEISFKIWHDSYPAQSTRYADDSVTIEVVACGECVWMGETAWADGLRYVEQGNWATYTPYEGEATQVDLFAGQTLEAGTVYFSEPADGYVTIGIVLKEGWRFAAVAENVKIQDYESAPSGNPSPGGFTHKGDADPVDDFFIIEVPDNNFYGIHVDVEQLVCE
jgi:hypothetical protein